MYRFKHKKKKAIDKHLSFYNIKLFPFKKNKTLWQRNMNTISRYRGFRSLYFDDLLI